MSLPVLKTCCCCIPLKQGCIIMTIISVIFCICNVTIGAWKLPHHKDRYPEDNVISMGMVMFTTLSLISNIVILVGIIARRPGFMQFAMLFNSLFILFCFLVGIVTCLFSPEYKPYMQSGKYVALTVVALLSGASYCIYYILVENSLYQQMKVTMYGSSPIPV